MTVKEAIQTRRSVRRYKAGAEIPMEDIEQILTAAMMAPSACNSRPWGFVVVKDRGKLDEIKNSHPFTKMLETASLAIIVTANPAAQNGIAEGFFPQDCGAATQNILLQAWELGYGTCWCGVYPSEERMSELKAILGIDTLPFNIIALGVPDEKPAARGYFEAEKVMYI